MLLDQRKREDSLCLAEFTHRELIVPRLQQRDLPGILGELVRVLHRQGVLTDPLPFYHAALNRECLSPSISLHGIAFPHARSPDVHSLMFALGRAVPPVPWNNATAPVGLVFLMAVPATESAPYLQLLAALSRLSQQPGWMEQLCADENAKDIFYHLYG